MSKRIFNILKNLADNITDKGYVIEGLELSYVDTQEQHLEVFTYSSAVYERAFQEGITKIGSLLFSTDTFKKKGVVVYNSKFRSISDKYSSSGTTSQLEFKNFTMNFLGIPYHAMPMYSKWISHYQKSNINGVFFFYGKRKVADFDLVLFGIVDGVDKKKLIHDVRSLLNNFTKELDDFSMVFERLRESRRDAIKLATLAVISDIINRNMAHHIISHVSNRATLDKVLLRIEKYHTDLADAKLYHTILDLLNRFNQYRDERGEFLTYITNFSSPSSALLFQDIIRPFVENALLMDNIAANENINYEKDENGNLLHNKLKLKLKLNVSGVYRDFYAKYFDKENNKIYSSENLPYFRLKGDALEYPYDRIAFNDNHKDIEVSLPGTLGKHALYSILENFIRNSAKHGGSKKHTAGLEIILLLEDVGDYIHMTLTDNCNEIKDSTGKIKIDIAAFNKSIQTPILERKDLGLIDMKVNACLLAGWHLTDDNCKKALEAIDLNNNLAYMFKIAKPKKAAYIGPFAKDIESQNGFYYFQTIDQYLKSDISKSFEFAVLADDLYENHKATISFELPARILKFSEVDFAKAEEMEHLYEAWLKKLRGDEKKAMIHLFFEQDNNTSPTKAFKDKYPNTNLKVYSHEDLRSDLTIEGGRNILFDRHGGLIGKFTKTNSFVDSAHSWILIDKNNSDFDYISRYDLESKANLLPYELEEAGLLNVLIVDERAAEQSMRAINHTDQACKLREEQRADFWKWEKQAGSFNLTLFDLAWAANVFLVTHLDNKPLKQETNEQYEHCLNLTFKDGTIALETNITSCSAYRKNQRWIDQETDKELTCSKRKIVNIVPDVIIIHRTILKNLLEHNANFIKELLIKNPKINLVVTTGSGTTHGIDGDYKIIPFSTLNKLILGKRIHKLQLSKVLMQLTKNKI
jgi:hypothetical protein